MRCNALARSVTMPIRLDHRISSSTPSIALSPPHEDAADRIHRRRPAWRDDRRGFTLFDDRRPLDALPRREHSAVVDGNTQAVAPGVNLARAPGRAGRGRQLHRTIE